MNFTTYTHSTSSHKDRQTTSKLMENQLQQRKKKFNIFFFSFSISLFLLLYEMKKYFEIIHLI